MVVKRWNQVIYHTKMDNARIAGALRERRRAQRKFGKSRKRPGPRIQSGGHKSAGGDKILHFGDTKKDCFFLTYIHMFWDVENFDNWFLHWSSGHTSLPLVSKKVMSWGCYHDTSTSTLLEVPRHISRVWGVHRTNFGQLSQGVTCCALNLLT